jgi:hypothetical protein
MVSLSNTGTHLQFANKTFQISHHAGAPPTALARLSVVPTSAYAAALKEYEDDTSTDSEGEMMVA